jgi:hypothetical protein
MKPLQFPIAFAFWLALCALTRPAAAQQASHQPKGFSDPFVAWADGQEVEIRFRLDKIRAAGLTLKNLECVKSMRFMGDNWTRKIGDTKVDLKAVAELKFRPLQAPPFTVKLLDGREAVITPRAAKVGLYLVTGEYFQQDVRSCLASPLVEDPAKAIVMSGLIVFGDLPHSTGPDKIHRSLGEPLREFARIEFRGQQGPQARELSRMRTAYNTTLEAMGRSSGTSRALFEKRFGPGEPADPKKPGGARVYRLRTGRLEVHWKAGGETVDYIYAIHGKELPTARADQPEKLAKEARDLADADRVIIVEYFSKMRGTLTAQERTWIVELLGRSQAELRWTEDERHLMLGDQKR